MKVIKHSLYFILVFSFFMVNVQCKNNEKTKENVDSEPVIEKLVEVSKEDFGVTADGISVDKFILKNKKGMEISIITYGGIITSWTAPDASGNYQDIVLGFDTLEAYEKETPFFGALIGRFGNRIAKGEFSLDGTKYTLATNDGENHLHGGDKGFDKVVWTAKEMQTDSTASIILNYLSKDMEEGYPGNLETTVTYTLNNNNELQVSYKATTDKKTIVNLTQHSYFNLSGDFSKTILEHEISINADKFIPVNETLIPTGELRYVANTPFDFREAKTIGMDINAKNDQLKKGLGYDHCWVLNNQNSGIRLAAIAHDVKSGRVLEVFTDEPGIQLYSGNFLDGTLPSKQGGTYAHRTGFCLETQHYPDAPNQKSFPSVVLSPGQTYTSNTSFKFSVKTE
ncbi:galactose mutarotase [Algibacter amylolyticus]|uniref:Aldose 1-epimerase n=1 Tax=Algibacter amylolyticus TaxID=1608400 RepID=A0A5M7B2L4_9FLAO|nr:aldose epimerase family protein [Algibacter amylolyticus]KAA5823692.1 galactose mutarotase [Algibacter amylolyticus]MBB5267861.1 aldose 1-epimerase [Algibacter amylolyticus]TSJ74180.1 galactose mutarotase [Algibacter amylolyticus]